MNSDLNCPDDCIVCPNCGGWNWDDELECFSCGVELQRSEGGDRER